VQKLIAALLAHSGAGRRILDDAPYTDLTDTASSLRTALTDDLDRRRRSRLGLRRRRRWHKRQAHAAAERIATAVEIEPFTSGGPARALALIEASSPR